MLAKTNGSKLPAWVFPVVVVAIAAILVIVVVLQNRPSSPTGEPSGQESTAPSAPTEVQGHQPIDLSEAETRIEGDPLAMGPADARVVMVIFSDYQCQFCARWTKDTLPLMMEAVDAGDLRIEWRDVNVFGPSSERAARAAYAAALQNRLSDYQAALFPEGKIRPESQLSDSALITLAVDLGLDQEQFTADLNAPETAKVIADNAQFGLDLGAYSTPVFILAGQPIVGAQPTEVFVSALELALEQAQ